MNGPVSTVVGVERFPGDVRSLATLDRIDYADLFVVSTPDAGRATPERWARAALEEGAIGRTSARRLWRALGLRLGRAGDRAYVQGWRIDGRGPDWIRAETSSWYMRGQAVVRLDHQQVSLALFLRFDQPVVARPLWSVVGPMHRRAVPVMLHQACGVVSALAGGPPPRETRGDSDGGTSVEDGA